MSASAFRMAAFDRHCAIGPIFIRVFAGVFLIYMAHDNVFSGERMAEFERFLEGHGFPLPAVSARVSVYAQFLAGIAFLLGALTRPAALLMVINFLIAIAMVHIGTPFRTFLEPSAMLASALFLLFNGAGAWSVDERLGWSVEADDSH